MILGVGAAGSTNIGEKSRDVNYFQLGSRNLAAEGAQSDYVLGAGLPGPLKPHTL